MSTIRPISRGVRRAIALSTAIALLAGLGACTVTPVEPDPLAVDFDYVGDGVRIDVDPTLPLAVSVPGLGRIVGASGSFSTPGQIIIRGLSAETKDGSVVASDGPGIDVDFAGTTLIAPLTLFFDDPSLRDVVPGDAVPLVLHRPDGQPWEAKALDFTPEGVPYLITSDFSPNILSWIQPPQWMNDFVDSLINKIGGGTDKRPCNEGGPDWADIEMPSALVHLCLISNNDQSSGVVRAELQIQSNRQHYEWVTVPAGADYVWAEGQPDISRDIVASIFGRDASTTVLLGEGDWMTVGYRQTAVTQTLNFRAYADAQSVLLDTALELIGVAPEGDGWISLIIIANKCKIAGAESAADFFGCAIKTSLENLAEPNKAFAAAMDIFGDKAYAEKYVKQLTNATSRLEWLGKSVRAIGLAQIVRMFILHWLDIDQFTRDPGFGDFRVGILPLPKTANPVPPVVTNPAPQAPVTVPDPVPAPQPPAPAPSAPRAWVSRSGNVITYHWQDMPAGMWPEVSSFRCWRYGQFTHPGGWASDGCGQQGGFGGFPSGTGEVSFNYPGANDSFSVEPWKYGPWLGVGQTWQG